MEYYCLMVKTGGEERFKEEAERSIQEPFPEARFWFFKSKRRDRDSPQKEIEVPLFNGYVFMGIEHLVPEAVEIVRDCHNFYKFLNSNTDITPLRYKDLEYFTLLIQHGEVQGISKVSLDVNRRIVIKSGPLMGFAGNIVRVNPRRHRVTVKLDLCGSISTFDLAYDVVEEIPEGQEEPLL